MRFGFLKITTLFFKYRGAMRQPISILVYPVRRSDEDWEYMLLRRVANSNLGLEAFWQGVTGGLEEGEDLTQAAKRELAEETGFVPSSLEKPEYAYSFPIQDEWKDMYSPEVNEIVEHVFIAFIDSSKKPILSHEHDKWEWCSVDQALGKLKYPGNIEALKQCAAILESRSGSKG